MDDKSRRFVDDDERVVFVNDVERHLFRLKLCDGRRRRFKFNLLARAQLVSRLRRATRDQHVAVFNRLLEARAAERGNLCGEISVEACARIRRRDDETQRRRIRLKTERIIGRLGHLIKRVPCAARA